MSRKTQKITYNIADIGRTYTGQNRSDVDIGSVVRVFNSKATQELIKNGDVYGYNGHEPRILYGMNPPDVVYTDDGKEIRIKPAVRTIFLKAESDGTVTHQQEFLDNDAGNYAYEQYKAKVGGFSSAVDFEMVNGKRHVTNLGGFDNVRIPNYTTNRGFGLFDSLWQQRNNPLTQKLLLDSMIHQYDAMMNFNHAQQSCDFFQRQALQAQQELEQYQQAMTKRQQRQQERKAQLLDSMICPSVPFDEYLARVQQFDSVDFGLNQPTDEATIERQQKLILFFEKGM